MAILNDLLVRWEVAKLVTINDEVEIRDLGEGVTRKVLSYEENMMAVEVSFEAGAIGIPHFHPHEQIGYVVSGVIEYMEDGKDKRVLSAGDSYYVPPEVAHGIVALEKTVLLNVYTPIRKDFLE